MTVYALFLFLVVITVDNFIAIAILMAVLVRKTKQELSEDNAARRKGLIG